MPPSQIKPFIRFEESFIPPNFWTYAKKKLANAPSGTKLRCYKQGELIAYQGTTLSHNFINIAGAVCARSHDKSSYILKGSEEDKITREEWSLAELMLKNSPHGTKLPTHKKKFITVSDGDENPFELTLSFIKVGNEIFAMQRGAKAGAGASAKAVYVVDQNNKCWVLKIFNKYADIPPEDVAREVSLSSKAKASYGHTYKIPSDPRYCAQPILVLEAYQNNFQTELKKIQPNITLSSMGDILTIILQVISSLEKLHQRRILHGDIKPQNILLNKNPGGIKATLCDFGLSLSMGDDGKAKHNDVAGTKGYIAPEIIISEGRNFSAQSDIFSVGMTLRYIISTTLTQSVVEKIENPLLFDLRNQLQALSWLMTAQDPLLRCNLACAKALLLLWLCQLICALNVIDYNTAHATQLIEATLAKNNSAIRDRSSLEKLNQLVTNYGQLRLFPGINAPIQSKIAQIHFEILNLTRDENPPKRCSKL